MTPLLRQLAVVAKTTPLRVIVTENVLGNLPDFPRIEGLDLIYVKNKHPKGFGANHNAAFGYCDTPFFCVLNPDIRLMEDPFCELLKRLEENPGVAGPRVIDGQGGVEDSARKVPSLRSLFGRIVRRILGLSNRRDYDSNDNIFVHWLAGMCLVFDRGLFQSLGGFDVRYHMYCEDVDICLRTWLSGKAVSYVNSARVQHDARRDSHRNFRYMWWHVVSLIRLFTSRVYWTFPGMRA
ncbi:glycosyltransferase [Cupriavidus taiwanensis]